MLPLPVLLSEREREVLRRLQTPWGEGGPALEHEVLTRLGPGDEADGACSPDGARAGAERRRVTASR